jgi:hypothetical protein
VTDFAIGCLQTEFVEVLCCSYHVLFLTAGSSLFCLVMSIAAVHT